VRERESDGEIGGNGGFVWMVWEMMSNRERQQAGRERIHMERERIRIRYREKEMEKIERERVDI
jgi:hypothetical protein